MKFEVRVIDEGVQIPSFEAARINVSGVYKSQLLSARFSSLLRCLISLPVVPLDPFSSPTKLCRWTPAA